MRMVDIILKKRNGEELSNFQIIDEAIGNIDTLLTEILGEGE